MKKALITIFSLLVVAVAAALIAPGFLDWNQYKSDITAQVQSATGRRLAIDGDIGLTILPAPALNVSAVRLANAPGARTPDMVTLGSLEVRVALMPLLSGEIQVDSLRIVRPRIFLEVLADGRPNWELGGPADTRRKPTASGGAADDALAGLRLDNVLVEEAEISFFDATTGLEEKIGSLTAEVAVPSVTGPYQAKGSLVARDLPLVFDVSAGKYAAAKPLAFTIGLDIAKGAGRVSLQGSMSKPSADGTLTGSVSVDAKNAQKLIEAVMAAVGGEVPALPGLSQAIALRGDVSANVTEAGLNNLELKLGETTAAGAVSTKLGDKPSVDLALDVNRVDLDAWLAAADTGKPAKKPEGDAAPAEPFALPADLTGTAAVTVDAVTYRGRAIRQVEASAGISGGVVTIEKFGAQLPGGARVDAAGTVQAVEGVPKFEGNVSTAADNLRGVLDWIGTDVSMVPADRLRKTALAATVRATPQLLEIYGIDFRLDSSKLTGGAAYAFRERPAFSVDFEIDQFSVDAYLKAETEPAEKTDEKTPDAKPADMTVLPKDIVELLNSFDTNIKLGVGKLAVNGVPIRGALVDIGLLAGEITVRRIKADDLGGAQVAFAGKARDLTGKPALSGTVDIRSDNASGLARLAGVTLPVPAERLGKVSARGKVDGNAERLGLDLNVTAARTSTALKGEVNLLGAATRLNLTMAAANKSYVRLWRVFDPEFEMAKGGKDGPLRIDGTVAGDLTALSLDLGIGLGEAQFKAAGKLSPLAGPEYNLAISAGHPDAVGFLNGLGVAYQPAASNLGGLKLSADIAGNGELAKLGNLDGNFGPVALAGAASASFSGPRPAITAGLATSEILVDLFVPRSSNGAGGSASSTGGAASPAATERWSSDPIDLSVLRTADMELDIQARGIIYGAYRFADPKVIASVRDGVLRIEPLTGKLFDGDVKLTAELSDDQVPAMNMAIGLTGADLQRTLLDAAGIDAVTGSVGLNGKFASSGHSQRDMISQLSGGLSFAAENGVAKGVDLKTLSDRLKTLDRTVDFLSLIQSTMSGGQTRYARLGGNFTIENGVARSDDIAAEMEAGAGAGRAVIDLPRWHMDMTGTFRLTEHPKAPPIGLVLRGPLDNPQRDIKSRDLENFIAQRVGGTLVRKLIGKKAKGLEAILPGLSQPQQQQPQQQPQQQQQQPQQQQPQRKLKPEDILKGLLKNLGN